VDENDDSDEEYLVDHSIVLYLLGPEGEFLEFYTQSTQVTDIVQSIEKHMKQGGDGAVTSSKKN
jgi:protein SCO1